MAAGQDLIRFAAALALAALVLGPAACRDRDKDQDQKDDAVDGEDRGPRPPVLRADRLGGLDARSRVDRRALVKAFPGLKVAPSPRGARGFDVLRGREKLFTVTPADDGSIASIEIESGQIATAFGAHVGDHFEKLQPGAAPLDCNGGLDRRARDVLCTPRRARNVTFIFTAGDQSYAGDDIPPEKLSKLLGGRPIRAILWRPPEPSAAAR